MKFADRTTDQLRTGDVVHNSGMRLVIDREISSREHAYGGRVYFTSALIDNADALRAEVAATGHDVYRFILAVCDQDTTGHRWQIQGNHLAHWAVEIAD